MVADNGEWAFLMVLDTPPCTVRTVYTWRILQEGMFETLVLGIILEAQQARDALPSSLFTVLTETRDVINQVFLKEHHGGEEGSGRALAGRRVLGGDDLLPIFIFVAARCSAVHAGGMALATMQEWMMRMGASTDASQEEYMGTTLGMAISALIHLEPGATTESSPETTTGSGRGSEG